MIFVICKAIFMFGILGVLGFVLFKNQAKIRDYHNKNNSSSSKYRNSFETAEMDHHHHVIEE